VPLVAPEATLVVCEDDPMTLELLCDHLEADRFGALPAPTAADVLRLAIQPAAAICNERHGNPRAPAGGTEAGA
jgi:hypothetical protein